MEEAITKLLTVYGPLGMGWLLAWYLLRQNTALQERILQSFIEDTKAKSEMKNALDALASIVKGQ
jgi:hypothetical protein